MCTGLLLDSQWFNIPARPMRSLAFGIVAPSAILKWFVNYWHIDARLIQKGPRARRRQMQALICGLQPRRESYRFAKAFTEAEVLTFTQITGDSNPIHVDPEAASRHGFPRCILPGMLSASLFPAIIGSQFPGAVYVKQDLNFRHPAMVGDSLFAEVSVLKVSRHRVVFSTICRDARGTVVVDGTALALLPSKSS